MTPAQVAASLDEPDWVKQWELLQAADDGFEALLGQWRRWHWTPIEINGEAKKQAAPATDGVIALAQLGVMPPRSFTERPGGRFEEQHDAQCWFKSQGRAWRVWAIKDGWLIVNSFDEEWRIDLKKMKWDNYALAAAAALEEQRNGPPPRHATEALKKGPDAIGP